MKVKSIRLKNNNTVVTVLKGAINALVISLISILIFAFVIKFVSVADGIIKPINQVIKILSIFLGCKLAFKNGGDKALIKGLLVGALYVLIAFALFSALNGSLVVNKSILYDLLFGALAGLISGVICNLFRKK